MRRISVSFIVSFLLLGSIGVTGQISYPAPFNPVKGLVHEVEQDQRQELCLNGKWEFMPVYNVEAADFAPPVQFLADPVAIKIPSPWNVNSFTDGQGGDFVTYPSYPKEWEKAKIGWMRKKINVPANWDEQTLKLHFNAVMGKTLVYVNGKKVVENFELFLPFEADVTDLIKPGQENEILVGVAKGDLFDVRGKYGRRTYVGGSMWGIEMAGIWQDVFLVAVPKVHIEDVFIQPDVKNNTLKIEVSIANNSNQKATVNVGGDIRKWYSRAGLSVNEIPEQKDELDGVPSLLFTELKRVSLEPNVTTKVTLSATVDSKLNYWTPQTPELYGAIIQLRQGKGIVVDTKYDRFGWRQFEISGDKLLLNGHPIQLSGDSWHFTGVPQMTRRYAWAWFNMLKNTNANAVRFHAQPFPHFYYDMADEMGICILDETGIWSSDGGPKIDSEAYWESCIEHIEKLVKRDKNHACVFGWSVCNETVPVAVNVFKAPETLVQRQLDEINRWVRTVQAADPTRPWISGDGETDRPTILPTTIGHYGGFGGMEKWATEGKPWGIGEQSMAYYGTPQQASKYNGNRAYESMMGRMEAIAIESYDLIKYQREHNASYSSVFNLVWYALQPLPLGMNDTNRQTESTDGIFFGFTEGAYGMQPERLGPFTSTLNPGYDPSLPLYRAWPLLDAVRCANATPILPNPIKAPEEKTTSFPVTPADAIILFAGQDSKLKSDLEGLGLKIMTDGKATRNTLYIIDGLNPPTDTKQLLAIRKGIDAGARIFVMGLTPETLATINPLLPYPIELGERRATSFLVTPETKEMQGLGHADFYFSELIPRGKTALHYGITGTFGKMANILLRACNTDWQRWNYRAETSKTGSVFRSELEAKGPDVVIASLPIDDCLFVVSTLDLKEIKLETQQLLSRILANLGAQVSNANLSNMQALDKNAHLNRALVWGPSNENDQPVNEMLTTDYIKGEGSVIPELNLTSAGQTWRVATADSDGYFEMSVPRSSGNRKNPVIYLSFWMYSPRSLSNLLAEPDMPNMDMFINAQGGVAIWLNGKQIALQELPQGTDKVKIPNVMPDKGWNHFVVKLVRGQQGYPVKASIHFDSVDKKFMEQVLSSLVR